MSFFDFHQFFVRGTFLTHGTYFWFCSCCFSKPYADWPSRHLIRPLSMLGDHCQASKNPKIQFRIIWPYVGLFGLLALRLKLLRSAEFLCQNGPHKAKKLQNFNKVAVALSVAFEKKFGLFSSFWGSLIPKKSSGIQKSCM